MRKLNRINKTKRKYYVVGTICIAMFFMMGIGYAILSQQLDISGTAQITSTWRILFTSAEEKEMNNATTISKQIVNQTTLNLNVELNQPGASATYDVVVENQGNLDAMLTAINGVDEANNQDPKSIKVELQNIRVNDGLLAGDKKTFQVKVYWDSSVDFDDVNMSKDVQISLVYEQRNESEIPSPPPTIDITDEVVTSGDGLYEAQEEDGRYVYRGNNPNNYIMFNNELWRIISKEVDGTYKIAKDESIGNMLFDEENHRLTTNNTYCDYPESGCNVYGAIAGTYTFAGQSGTVTEDSSIAEYLNGEYYNSLTPTAKSQMQTHAFNIGGVLLITDAIYDLPINLQFEKAYQWTGNIGLPNVTDIIQASLNRNCYGAALAYQATDVCTMNYLVDDMEDNTILYTLNGYSDEMYAFSYEVWVMENEDMHKTLYINSPSYISTDFKSDIRPVLFLKSTTQIIDGDGSKSNPYIIQ